MALALAALARGATFECTFHTTEQTAGDSDFVVLSAVIKNQSPDSLKFMLIKQHQKFPSSWTAAFCVNQECFAPFADTIKNLAIGPGDTAAFSLDIETTAEKGVAKVLVSAVNALDETDRIEQVLKVSTGTGVIRSIGSRYRAYNIPQANWVASGQELLIRNRTMLHFANGRRSGKCIVY